jgi:hypothetical protein
MRHYILAPNGEPILEPDFMKWAQWFEHSERKVAFTALPTGAFISTVFIGLDHGSGEGSPVLWETMVFDHNHKSLHQVRCAGSREQAQAMHQRMCDHFLKKEGA